jgi:glutamate synthase domain-containing protein 3
MVVEGAGKYAFEYMTGGVGVVLGPVGPVIGSGLTGGVVYLLAEDQLAAKVHSSAQVQPLDDQDERQLRQLVEAHRASTGSERAEALLADWRLDRFAKIVPRI